MSKTLLDKIYKRIIAVYMYTIIITIVYNYIIYNYMNTKLSNVYIG
jgi:predicted membrane chloride channel (bestrophin family)